MFGYSRAAVGIPFQPVMFGDFLLVQPLSLQNMTEVFVAVRMGDRNGRMHVLKRPRLGERKSGRAAQAILRETEVLETVQSNAIARLEAAGEISGLPYLVTEYVRGVPLDVLLEKHGALPSGAVAAIAMDLGRALVTLHEAGWVHADVAPSNMIIDDAGELRLVDMGIATQKGSTRHELAGKPGYIPPELLHAPTATTAEDVYAWGVVVSETILGRRLFAERELVEAGQRDPIPSRLRGDAQWGALLSSALDRDPTARPTASALQELIPADADRSLLATLVGQELSGDSEHAMAAEHSMAAPSSSRDTAIAAPPFEEVSELAAEAEPPPQYSSGERATVTRPPRRKAIWQIAFVLAVGIAGLAVGLSIGRRQGRAQDGHLTVTGTIPARVDLELDGKPITIPVDGSPLSVRPGRHVLSVTTRTKQKRDIPFTVRPGENVVLVPLPANRLR